MAYNIKLEVFEGPLDLLLHLIKENEVDIYDIPIATITERYLEYLNMMKALNLDMAGEFLVMAATLTYIKSRNLLPRHEQENEQEEDGIDPRDELVARLVEYRKFKEAAMTLKGKELEQSQVFTRTPLDDEAPDDGDLLLEVNVFELLKSFKRVLDNHGGARELSVSLEEISVTDKLNEIMARLEADEFMTFDALFARGRNRMEIVATFLALLELVRLKLARARQTRAGGEILIYRCEEENGVIPDETNTSKAQDKDNNPEQGAQNSGKEIVNGS